MVPLGLALRFVLEALRKPTDSNMFYFGVAALDRFKSRLKEYPQYCQHVQAIQHFKDFPAHLVLWVEAGTLSSEPPSKPTAPRPSAGLTGGACSQSKCALLHGVHHLCHCPTNNFIYCSHTGQALNSKHN